MKHCHKTVSKELEFSTKKKKKKKKKHYIYDKYM